MDLRPTRDAPVPNAACDAGSRLPRDLVAVSLRLGEGRDAGVVVVDALSVVAAMAREPAGLAGLGLAEDRLAEASRSPRVAPTPIARRWP